MAEASSGRREIAGWSVRWDPARAEAAYAEGLWGAGTLADALRRAAEETPDRILVLDGAHALTARDLRAQASAMAQALVSRGPAGSVVSIMLPNWWESAVVYLAATLAGMVAHPVLTSLRDADLRFALEDAGSRVVFVPHEHRGHDFPAMLSRVATQLAQPPEVVVLRGDAGPHTPYAAMFDPAGTRALPVLDPDAVRLVLYTSGTTGRPKGVLHSHNSLNALMRQVGRYWSLEPGDVFLVPAPIGHIGGSIYTFEAPLLLGSKAVLMDRWEPDEAVEIVEREGCTHIIGATPFLDQLLKAAKRAGKRLPSLKLFICGGASVPPSLIREASDWFETTIISRVYGSTEVPVATVGAPTRADLEYAAETDGRAGFAEIKLVDAQGAVGDEGEILARGPQMLVGFLHPEDEATTFDADGYYRSGDLGRWVDGDYLVVSGRAKDIIIRNGENISPKEVEDVLARHPDIADVAIVGLPDPRTGERACAVIVPRDGPGPGVADLREFLKTVGVASFKIPEQVEIWESLPRNDGGKVMKHRIRATLTGAAPQG